MEEEYQLKQILNDIDKYVGVGQSSVEKGRRFCEWILKYMFEQSNEQMEELCPIDGKNDNSIDILFEEDKTLNIIQAKYNTAHNWSQVAQFLVDIRRVLSDTDKIVGDNPYLYEVSETIKEYVEQDKYIELYYITSNLFSKEEKQKIEYEVENLNNVIESKNDKISVHILDIEDIKDFIDMALDVIPKKFRDRKASLILKNKFISNITCVAEVELKHFILFVKKNKEYLFYSNIRNYLRATPVNKGIIDTFENKPTDFWYFNNGITIVCDDFELKNGTFLEITLPQIVNGCQTANTILKAYKNLSTEKQNTLQGTILVKVIKDKNKKKKDQITQYTNRQNAVSGKDFFALDLFQRKMLAQFKDVGYFYEIQNKASLAKNKNEIQKYKGIATLKYLFPKKFDNVLPVKVVVQAYAAGMHFMPGTAASRSGELMVYGKKWGKIFNDFTPEDYRWWLYPYGVMNYAKSYLDYTNKSSVTYKRYSLMFFVACYFRTIVHICKKVNVVDKMENTNPLRINIDFYSKIFEDASLNKDILEFVDSVLKRFMRDKSIKNIIEERYGSFDISNFMKSEVETNDSIRKTLDEFITEELEDRGDIIEQVFSTCKL